MPVEAPFLLYCPFCIDGRHTADSNTACDRSLRLREASGVRDTRNLQGIAAEAGMALEEDLEISVNNRTLVGRETG